MTTGPVSEFAHARAPGKVNVFLKVGAVLDDCYHEVAWAYQALSLYEDVRAYPADDFSVSFVGGSVGALAAQPVACMCMVGWLSSILKEEVSRV
jgi:4-diphosphocytidyl-2C-methyl-D-erythritol kinase